MVIAAFCTAICLSSVGISTAFSRTPFKSNSASAPVSPTTYLYGLEIVSAPQQDDGGLLGSKNIRIINLGPVVNHSGLDYAPAVSADGKTLYFVSNRSGSKLGKGGFSHDFWMAKKQNNLDTTFFVPVNIDTSTALGNLGVNTPLNEGVATIAADRQTLIFTGCDRPDGLGDCDLYIAEIEGDQWGRPRNMGRNINSQYWESQPTISPDKSRIYFASNRGSEFGEAGDQEHRDIWYSDYDFELEEWKPAINLKALNTNEKDMSPFIAADNQTLFFASGGHKPNFGGTDFYIARRDDRDNWSRPENLGQPINTNADEAFITVPASGDVLYFASTRRDIASFQGNYDIFMAFVPSFFKAVNIIATVKDECSGANIPALVTIKNPITGKVYRDSVNSYKTDIQLIVNATDFGRPEDSINVMDLEVTASNARYGEVRKVQQVLKPQKVQNETEAAQKDEIRIDLSMGQRPRLEANMALPKKTPGVPADFKGLLLTEVATRELFPLLNYVFFDEGSSTLPVRYVKLNPSQVAAFNDEKVPGGTIDKYHNVLNIYGYRLRKFPNATIRLVGTLAESQPGEKAPGLAQNRAQTVFNYFKDVWGIDPSRMKIESRGWPATRSNPNDTFGIVENRRVEIITEPFNWDIIKPILEVDPKRFPDPVTMTYTMTNGIEDELIASRRIEIEHGTGKWNTLSDLGAITNTSTGWDWQNTDLEYPAKGDESPFRARLIVTNKNGSECISDPVTIKVKQISLTQPGGDRTDVKTLERYNLILFPFDSYEAGPLNQRILDEYVFSRAKANSDIQIEGHTDVVGMYEHNKRLSDNRAKTVRDGVNAFTKGKYNSLTSRGTGEDEPIYTNDLPEGRFYNRTVQINIQTPIE
ncbi:MAG TPA: OmpA family protein [Patescibacteria group bacterium]|nr:OmpA family protein [Patescibacteria group bacterium]